MALLNIWKHFRLKNIRPLMLGMLWIASGCNAAFTDVQFNAAENNQDTDAPDPIGSYSGGYVFTRWSGEGTQVDELTPRPYRVSDEYCLTGEMTFTPDYLWYAQLVFTLSQTSATASEELVQIEGDGITLNIDNPTRVPLRVEISAGEEFWCTHLSDHSGPVFIPFDAFLSECWVTGSHEPFRGDQINEVRVAVPAPREGVAQQTFDICVGALNVYGRETCTWNNAAGTYYECGATFGYVWSLADEDSTLNETGFESHVAGEPFCISGTLGQPYGAAAGIGFNLAQSEGAPDPAPFEVTQDGVQVNYFNNELNYNAFRLQLTGTGEPPESWCFDGLPTGGVSVPFTSFQKECWVQEGAVYRNEPLTNVMVVLVGDNQSTHPYDFCVTSFGVY